MLETQRLRLRQWQESDKEPFYSLNSNPHVMRYFPKTLTREESDFFADRTVKIISEQGWGFFAVELKESQKFIGFIGLSRPHFEAPFMPCVEIGWRLSEESWGQGFAPEGARAALRYGFENLHLKEIVSFTATCNQPSRRVMEKIGMKQDLEGTFQHPRVEDGHALKEHVLYRIKSSEFDF